MATAGQKGRNRRTVDLMFGVFAELGLAGTLWVWSWGGAAAEQAPLGAPASVGALTAAFVLVAGAMVVRARASRSSSGAMLAALVGVSAVVACLAVMVFMTLAAGDTLLWWQLLWSGGSAAVFGYGLAGVWDRSRRERVGRTAG